MHVPLAKLLLLWSPVWGFWERRKLFWKSRINPNLNSSTCNWWEGNSARSSWRRLMYQLFFENWDNLKCLTQCLILNKCLGNVQYYYIHGKKLSVSPVYFFFLFLNKGDRISSWYCFVGSALPVTPRPILSPGWELCISLLHQPEELGVGVTEWAVDYWGPILSCNLTGQL